jgi:hypothetical protein
VRTVCDGGAIDAGALLAFVRLSLRRLESDEYQNATFIGGLADILNTLDHGQWAATTAQDSAAMTRDGFLDRFPEAGRIQIGMATAAMKVK